MSLHISGFQNNLQKKYNLKISTCQSFRKKQLAFDDPVE